MILRNCCRNIKASLIKRGFSINKKEKVQEIVQNYWEAQRKAQQLCQMIKNAKYPIFFTGAGISTSQGIPDYRSGQQTILKTGPGLWNRIQKSSQNKIVQHTPIDKLVDNARPSLSHMFIATMIKQNIFKHVISQNTDGLHLKSGIPFDKISELHGNRNLQFCISCHSKYNRDYRTLKRDGIKYQHGQKRPHLTGRQCENCGGDLHDSIIYFGQKLPEKQLKKAYNHAYEADLCICIGSSLTVKPSSNIPLLITKKPNPGELCIINLQQTPLDIFAQLRIGYFCDDILQILANKMNINLQKLVIEHYLQIKVEQKVDYQQLIIQGKDRQGNNLSFIKRMELIDSQKNINFELVGHRCKINLKEHGLVYKQLIINIHHFGEKQSLLIDLSSFNLLTSQKILIKYSKQQGKQWEIMQIE